MDDQQILQRALAGDAAAVRTLVDRLTPIVQARVARALARRVRAGRDLRQEVEDMTQECFLSLFDDDGRALRRWEPGRGLSLDNFVGLIAERQVASILRSGRRSPWTEDPTDAEDLAPTRGTGHTVPPQEARAVSRQTLALMLDALRASLSPRGLDLFYRLFVYQQEIPTICAETGLDRNAVYAWKSRLARKVRAISDGLLSDPGPAASAPRAAGEP